ncbi:MAG: N-acetylneuraminate lyase [Verrucomicrobiota bacterium]
MSLPDSLPTRVPLITAPVTPFAADGSLALGSVEALAEWLVRQGVDGVFVNGTTGESHSLSVDERRVLAERWVSVLRGTSLRCIIHVGSNCLREARELAVHAQQVGASGIAALAPSYFKPADVEAWVEASAFIAGGAPALPFHAYDLPAMTGIHLASDRFLIQATERIPTMAGLKFSNPDLVLLQRCVAALGPKQELLYGCDDLLLPAVALGATGAVGSTYALAAPLYRAMQAAAARGDWALARRAQRHSIRLIEILGRHGYLGSLKVVLNHQGLAVGSVRLPLRPPAVAFEAELLSDWESWSVAMGEITAAKA